MHRGHFIQIIGLFVIIINAIFQWMNIWLMWVLVGILPFIYSGYYSCKEKSSDLDEEVKK